MPILYKNTVCRDVRWVGQDRILRASMRMNHVAPGEDPGLSELRIYSFVDLYRWHPWKPEIYQDYDAPIVASIDGQFRPLIAGFGCWPRALQKVNIEKTKEQGKKPPIMRSTMNVRDDNLGKSPLYGPAWKSGARCLIPARYVVEPSYPDAKQDTHGSWTLGACMWQQIGVEDRETMCIAGIWRTVKDSCGNARHVMTMITVNADDHPIM